MARREAINTFTDGLNTDLNPINTPNTVLTDCLNGTLITYDGNELTLQNDKGNYPLKNCKLKENFIPVGVKEYGDIIYIVSYNPITEQTQIGSYPAPERITNPDDFKGNADYEVGDDENPLEIVLPTMWDTNLVKENNEPVYTALPQINPSFYTANYSDLVPIVENLEVFYAGDNKDLTLNPGDEYQIVVPEPEEGHEDEELGPFESIQYLVLDNDKKTFDITDNVNPNETYNSDGFHYVNWKVPGYLCVKTKMSDIDEFKCGAKIVSPNYIATGHSAVTFLDLYLQTFTTDQNIIEHYTNVGFKIIVTITPKTGNEVSFEDSFTYDALNSNKIDYGNGETLLSHDYNVLPICISNNEKYKFKSDDFITINVIPYFKNNEKYIYLDKYEKTLSFNLSNKVDIEKLKIGDTVWKYTTSDDKLTLKFNTKGVLEQSVFSEDIKLKYNIRRYLTYDSTEVTDENYQTKTVIGKNGTNLYNINIPEWDPMTETTLSIPFVPFPSSESYDNNTFYKEDCYVMEIKFVNESNNQIGSTIKRVILASELLNDFYDSRNNFDNIYFDEWVGKYKDHVKNLNVDVNATITSSNPEISDAEFSSNYELWSEASSLKAFPHFIDLSSDKYTVIQEPFDVSVTANLKASVSYTNSTKVLFGPLWYGLPTKLKYSHEQDYRVVNYNTGVFSNPESESNKDLFYIRTKRGKFREYDNNLKTVFDYEKLELTGRMCYINIKSIDDSGEYSAEEKSPKIQIITQIFKFDPTVAITSDVPQNSTQYQDTYISPSNESTKVVNDQNTVTGFILDVMDKEKLDYLLVRMNIVNTDNVTFFSTAVKSNGSDQITGDASKTGTIFGIYPGTGQPPQEGMWFFVFRNEFEMSNRRSANRLVFKKITTDSNSITNETLNGYINAAFSDTNHHIYKFEKSNEQYFGNFYIVDTDTIMELEQSDINIDTTCELIRGKSGEDNIWTYGTYNLLSTEGRYNIQQRETTNLSKYFSNSNITHLDNISLNVTSNDILISSEINTSMENKFSSALNTINSNNDTVRNEAALYQTDANLINSYKDVDSSYIITPSQDNNNDYINILNNEISPDNIKDVAIWSYRGLSNSWKPTTGVHMGKYYNSTTTTNSQSS